jgi:hypothetical protein
MPERRHKYTGEELIKCLIIASVKQLIEQDSQAQVLLFRPPDGCLNQPLINMINGMGLNIVLCSIDPGYCYASPNTLSIMFSQTYCQYQSCSCATLSTPIDGLKKLQACF